VLIAILSNIENVAVTLLKIRENNIDLYMYITLSRIHFTGQYIYKIYTRNFFKGNIPLPFNIE